MIKKIDEWTPELDARIALIPEATKEMKLPYPFYSEDMFITSDKGMIFEKLLPKQFEYNDYSKSEDLIEIANLTTGNRHWMGTDNFFSHPCGVSDRGWKLGVQIRIRLCEQLPDQRQISSYYLLQIIDFGARLYRKRSYLQAVFEKVPNSEVDMYITKGL